MREVIKFVESITEFSLEMLGSTVTKDWGKTTIHQQQMHETESPRSGTVNVHGPNLTKGFTSNASMMT